MFQKSKLMKSISILISFTLFLSSCTIEDKSQEIAGLQAGDALPEFSISNSQGENVSNFSCIGKVSLIIFINTECSDCIENFTLIQKIYDKFRDNQNCLFAVIARGETEEKARTCCKNFTFPIFGDKNADIYNLFAMSGIPRFYLVGKRGYISSVQVKNINEDRLIRNITYLLNK